jgi:RNA polymerase sigma factor for flagellar operon FliA
MLASVEDSVVTRDDLICAHLPQVHIIAKRLHAQFNGRVELADLISAGTIGLITAVDRFDSSFGTKLKTYAEHKIRGAILDSVNTLDGRSKDARRLAKSIEAATASAEQRLGRAATHEEIAAEMDISIGDLHHHMQRSATVSLLSMSGRCSQPELDMVMDVPSPGTSPEEEAQRDELRASVDDAIATLDPRESEILRMYYGDGLTVPHIAEALHEPEWRVLKLKHRALKHTRERLGEIVRTPLIDGAPVQHRFFASVAAVLIAGSLILQDLGTVLRVIVSV